MTDQDIRDHRARLVEALRGPEYIQYMGALKVDDGEAVQHCASGVACEVFRDTTGRGEWTRSPWLTREHQAMFRFSVDGDNGFYVMPDQVLDFFGFTKNQERRILRANDSGLWDFERIASMIEGW